MRDRQDIVLREAVEERERQLVVVERAVDRVKRHILEHVVHPAHVPLEVEAQSADVGGLGHERPRGGLLRDHQHVGVLGKDRFVQVTEELDRLQILVAAVDVRRPFAVAAVVVQIEHGRHGIHAQTVQMELVQPVVRAGDQERAYLALAVVKDARTPALVLHLLGVGIFIAACAVKFVQTVRILREVGRYPVEDDADARLMEQVDHLAELIGRAEA